LHQGGSRTQNYHRRCDRRLWSCLGILPPSTHLSWYRLGCLEFNRGVRKLRSLVPKRGHLPSPGQLLFCLRLCSRLHRPHLHSALHLLCPDPLPPQRLLHRRAWLWCRLHMRLQWNRTFRNPLPDGAQPLCWVSLRTWRLPSPARRLPLRMWTRPCWVHLHQ